MTCRPDLPTATDRSPIGGTMTKISAVIPDDLDAALKERARAEDRSVGAVVRRAIAHGRIRGS